VQDENIGCLAIFSSCSAERIEFMSGRISNDYIR
jgi:hypothetical protein